MTALACVDRLGQAGVQARSVLKDALRDEGSVGMAAVNALERIGGATAESALVAGLAISDQERSMAIARALDGVGSLAAVPALKEAAGRGGKLKATARQAIAEILARTGGAAGQLSLAEGDEGGLSLADERAGQVSLVQPRRKKRTRRTKG